MARAQTGIRTARAAAMHLEVHLLWRDTLIEAWHLRPNERLELNTLPLPEAAWPIFEWRSGDATCIHEPAWSAGSGCVYTRTTVDARRPLVITPHVDFEVRAHLVDAAATGFARPPQRSFAIAACSACLLVGVMGVASVQGALDSPTVAANAGGIDEVAYVSTFAVSTRALLPSSSTDRDVTEPIPADPHASPRPTLPPARHPDQIAALHDASTELTRLLDAAFATGEVPIDALVDAYLAADAAAFVRHGSGDLAFTGLVTALRTRLERAAATATPDAPVESLAAVTHALVGDPRVLYRRDRNALSDLVADGRLNCQGASVAIALALLMADPGGLDAHPVFVHTPGHVQPGLLVGERLHVVEATHTGARVGSANLDDLRQVRVTDARLQLVALLSEFSGQHRWSESPLAGELVLFDRLDDAETPREAGDTHTMPGMRGAVHAPPRTPAGDQERTRGGDPLAGHRKVVLRRARHPPRYDILLARPASNVDLPHLRPDSLLEERLDGEHRAPWLRDLKRTCSRLADTPAELQGELHLVVSAGTDDGVSVTVVHDTLLDESVTRCLVDALAASRQTELDSSAWETIRLSWP